MERGGLQGCMFAHHEEFASTEFSFKFSMSEHILFLKVAAVARPRLRDTHPPVSRLFYVLCVVVSQPLLVYLEGLVVVLRAYRTEYTLARDEQYP